MSASAEIGALADASGDILVVDDFPDTLALYEAVLSEDGHRIRTAMNGLEALRQVDEREPELVLLDVSMPGLNGVEVLRRLRARPTRI
jgi:CheY-like chemotaxis protein